VVKELKGEWEKSKRWKQKEVRGGSPNIFSRQKDHHVAAQLLGGGAGFVGVDRILHLEREGVHEQKRRKQ